MSIVYGDLREEILKLKQQEGKNILTGAVDVPSQLIQLGLVDEYYVCNSTTTGRQRELLVSFTLKENFQFVESKIFKPDVLRSDILNPDLCRVAGCR